MDYDRAKRTGDAGEQIVAGELDRLAPQHGLTIVRGLLLHQSWGTSQIDFAVVDRFGVLVLECKVRNGALIRGRDTDNQWTACYPRSRNHKFQNPLLQARSQEGALRQVLEKAGSGLGSDYIRSAVVFSGADISELDLDSLARARVVTVEQLSDLMQRRHSFSVNLGDLSAADIATLVGTLQGMNRTADPVAERAHADHQQGRRSDRPSAPAGAARLPSQAFRTPPALPTRSATIAGRHVRHPAGWGGSARAYAASTGGHLNTEGAAPQHDRGAAGRVALIVTLVLVSCLLFGCGLPVLSAGILRVLGG